MRRNILWAGVIALILAGAGGAMAWFIFVPGAQVEPVPVVELPPDPGALIEVSMQSRVAVLLDEIPQDEREKLVQAILDKPKLYWKERAVKQIRFSTLRRNYGIKYGYLPLPLPPEELWWVSTIGQPIRETIDGHDVVVVDYSFNSVLLTDIKSPAGSAKELGAVGGKFEDTLTLPLDPEFVFQRTGYACMNESESPPNSIDAEEADFYYDQKCKVEEKLTNIGCHQTAPMPTESCEDAVVAHIGAARPIMTFERLKWNEDLAAQVRTGEITNPDGPDLQPIQSRFEEHRITYRYIPADSCTLVEKCVGASGWRQLLMFPTGDLNTGSKALDIGKVDYFHQSGGSLLATHGVYELSQCHGHYHFSHYGSFTLGNGSEAVTHKQGFCLQPTSRLMNNELSPINHPYSSCIDQGVAVGWVDEYQMGLECQWLDVTDVRPKTAPLSFVTNPDGMMCEGTRKFDADGKQLFEPTEFKTTDGEPVDRPQCDFYPDWEKNNTASYNVTIPLAGLSYITDPCVNGEFGPLRNCGLKQQKKVQTCEPGSTVTISCSTLAESDAQVVRLCEASKALKTGIPCVTNDALASMIVSEPTEATFTCPAARDEVETGGSYAYFTAPLFPEEKLAVVTCEVTEVIPAPLEEEVSP